MESREDKSLFQNHVFIFKITSFTTFVFSLIIIWFFIKITVLLSKIGPIRALWAHMGPNRNKFLLNSDRACRGESLVIRITCPELSRKTSLSWFGLVFLFRFQKWCLSCFQWAINIHQNDIFFNIFVLCTADLCGFVHWGGLMAEA